MYMCVREKERESVYQNDCQNIAESQTFFGSVINRYSPILYIILCSYPSKKERGTIMFHIKLQVPIPYVFCSCYSISRDPKIS